MEDKSLSKLKGDIDRICGVGPIPSFDAKNGGSPLLSGGRLPRKGCRIRSIKKSWTW